MLMDLDDPSKVIGVASEPLIMPEAEYELEGFRGNTIFPTGVILEDSGELRIYYGSGDAIVALATAPVQDVIDFVLAS